ncbi:MAG: hypothetical protein EAZ92_06005 [Candidatus Kapaibacterium sp.]|nr:MAG: hypothetical protein EAZ92_06005 [Candidatus Kapabacteria bacterium]
MMESEGNTVRRIFVQIMVMRTFNLQPAQHFSKYQTNIKQISMCIYNFLHAFCTLFVLTYTLRP